MSGAVSYHAGLSAEGQVAREYERRGMPVAAHRWRGTGGEIDLIARDGEGYVFVEVKKSRDHARAAERLNTRQIARLFDAASEFLGLCKTGLDTLARFDVALIDAQGRIEIVENALGA
ncbi:MAG: YraN family protein [Pararhodobacter sp.]|nr:YraN family protein [Pararhodobacter sp.]